MDFEKLFKALKAEPICLIGLANLPQLPMLLLSRLFIAFKSLVGSFFFKASLSPLRAVLYCFITGIAAFRFAMSFFETCAILVVFLGFLAFLLPPPVMPPIHLLTPLNGL